jgi:fatty acid elongase 3
VRLHRASHGGERCTVRIVSALALRIAQFFQPALFWIRQTLERMTRLQPLLEYSENFGFRGAPLSRPVYPLAGIAIYLLVITGLERVMRTRRPFSLRSAVVLHNVFLTLLSLAMGFGTLIEIMLHAVREPDGLRAIACDHRGTVMRGRLLFWMYVFYVSKYYELLDTIIMVLRKRPLSFLHVYHHCVVLPLFWMYLRTSMVIHFILVVANSFVHVFMYYYYAVSALGYRVWWKQHLTMAQIVQFVIDLTATYPFVYFYFRHPKGCSGSMRAFIFGQLVGISFCYLFWDFFRKSYRTPKQSRSREKEAALSSEPTSEAQQFVKSTHFSADAGDQTTSAAKAGMLASTARGSVTSTRRHTSARRLS